MEDALTFFGEWKTASIFLYMEDTLKYIFLTEDDLKFLNSFFC